MAKSLYKFSLYKCRYLTRSFIFDSKLYRQIEGVGMGLPLDPTLAVFMCAHESKWSNDCPDSFKPVFFLSTLRIDYTFVLFTSQNHAVQFLDYLNSKHPNIKFTIDAEKDGKISFLDVSVSRKNNIFSTSVFRKKTFSGKAQATLAIVALCLRLTQLKLWSFVHTTLALII